MSIPQNNSMNSVQPPVDAGGQTNTAPSTSIRQGFKFSTEQKQIMMDKFNAGLHYPTNTEKEALAARFGVSIDSVHYIIVQLICRSLAGLNVHEKRKAYKDHERHKRPNHCKCHSTILNNHLSNRYNNSFSLPHKLIPTCSSLMVNFHLRTHIIP
jgi:hypothetical protein